MVHGLQCCAGCGDRVGVNSVWVHGRWESEHSEEFACGCGQSFCSIDCLIDHGEEAHTNGDITTWPEGTDSRLFDSGEVERRWRERQAIAPEHSESGSDEDSSDSNEERDADLIRVMRDCLASSSDSDSDSDDSDDEHDVTCECGNYVGTVCNGAFHQLRGAIPSECDQDGVRWCEDCWHPLQMPQQQEEQVEEEGETEHIPDIRCECCSKKLDLNGFTNNKGSFCSNSCLQIWSGCPDICREKPNQTQPQQEPVQRRLDFQEVAANAAVDLSDVLSDIQSW